MARFCGKCGSMLDPATGQCAYCGDVVETPHMTPGQMQSGERRQTPHAGTSHAESQRRGAQHAETTQAVQRGRVGAIRFRRKWIVGLAIVAAVIVIFLLGTRLHTGSTSRNGRKGAAANHKASGVMDLSACLYLHYDDDGIPYIALSEKLLELEYENGAEPDKDVLDQIADETDNEEIRIFADHVAYELGGGGVGGSRMDELAAVLWGDQQMVSIEDYDPYADETTYTYVWTMNDDVRELFEKGLHCKVQAEDETFVLPGVSESTVGAASDAIADLARAGSSTARTIDMSQLVRLSTKGYNGGGAAYAVLRTSALGELCYGLTRDDEVLYELVALERSGMPRSVAVLVEDVLQRIDRLTVGLIRYAVWQGGDPDNNGSKRVGEERALTNGDQVEFTCYTDEDVINALDALYNVRITGLEMTFTVEGLAEYGEDQY